MLHKNEQNASKTQVVNYKKSDSNIVLLLICDFLICKDGLYKIRFNISLSSGHPIDQSKSFFMEAKPKKSELVFRINLQLNLSIKLSLIPCLQIWSFGWLNFSRVNNSISTSW